MNVGLPREVKDSESRVGMVPSGVLTLKQDGHTVYVERDAGQGSGFSNEEYEDAGAVILESADDLFEKSDLIVKVKEPVEEEFDRMQEGQIIFSYLHLAPLPELTDILIEKQVAAVAYETIPDSRGTLPLLTPMSEIAGRMSIIVGTYYLQKPKGGRGILLAGVPGVRPALVVIIGGGVVGINATKMAMGLGAQVSVLDVDVNKLRYLDDLYFGRVETLMSNTLHLVEALKRADLVVGGVLIPGASAPKLVDRETLAQMKPGSVVVDVAVDQGGCFETTRPTTHSQPVYEEEGVLHYCVTNMPGAVPRTSTLALTNATLPYVRKIASLGLQGAIEENPYLGKGVNVYRGHITCRPVASAQERPYRELATVL